MRVRGNLKNGEAAILPCGARSRARGIGVSESGVGRIRAFQAQRACDPYTRPAPGENVKEGRLGFVVRHIERRLIIVVGVNMSIIATT
jgi:hypothetical protein